MIFTNIFTLFMVYFISNMGSDYLLRYTTPLKKIIVHCIFISVYNNWKIIIFIYNKKMYIQQDLGLINDFVKVSTFNCNKNKITIFTKWEYIVVKRLNNGYSILQTLSSKKKIKKKS